MIDKKIFLVFDFFFVLVNPGPKLLFGQSFFWLKRTQIADKGGEYF
jgi:hypothetical protein